jgi:ABC-type transport system involved in multi-copper enzyme maturation permease subunit
VTTSTIRGGHAAQRLGRNAWLILRRELRAQFSAPWFFMIACAACLFAWWYGVGFQAAFRTETVIVAENPLTPLNAGVITFLGVMLGLRLATAIAWEREHGTIEVLLSGPVAWADVVLGKFLGELVMLASFIAIYQAYLVLAQPLGAGVLSLPDVAAIAALALVAMPFMALGLLVSCWARTVRTAVIMYLVAVSALAAFEVARVGLAALAPGQATLTALYLKAGLEALAPAMAVVSAAARAAHVFESAGQGTPVGPASHLLALGLTVATLVVGHQVARMRGTSR